MLSKGTLLGSNWRIESYLGEGACAKVYVVSSVGKPVNYEVVAKVIPLGNGGKSKKDKEQEKLANTLYYEYVLLTGLVSEFPYRAQLPSKFYGDDESKKLRFLVMERFEYDLKHLAKQGNVTPAKASDIGIQLLKGLQWLHQKGFVFVDVKPDNFMMKANKAFFVDFGLVERIGSTPPGGVRQFAGTPTYCSINLNRGGEPSAADDIEALGYVLLSLFNSGELPWEHSSSDQELLTIKQSTNIKQFATSLGCPEVGDFIDLARTSANYSQLEQYLTRLASREGRAQKAKSGRKSTEKPITEPSKAQKEPLKRKESPVTAEEPRPSSTREKKRQKPNSSDAKEETKVEVEAEDDETVEVAASLQQKVTLKQTRKLPGNLLKQPTTVIEIDDEDEEPIRASTKSSSSSSAQKKAPRKSEEPPLTKIEDDKKENLPNLFTSPRRKNKTPFSSTPAEISKPLQHHLRVVSGPHKDSTFNIDQLYEGLAEKTLSLGRDEENNINFSGDFTVSSKHLSMKKTEEGIFIKDNGSTNKTRINNERIYSRRWFPIQPNDKVSLGETEFQLVIE